MFTELILFLVYISNVYNSLFGCFFYLWAYGENALLKCLKMSKPCVLQFLVQIKGWDGLYRIEETKLECAIPRKLIFDWKTQFVGIGDPKIVLNTPKMNPKLI